MRETTELAVIGCNCLACQAIRNPGAKPDYALAGLVSGEWIVVVPEPYGLDGNPMPILITDEMRNVGYAEWAKGRGPADAPLCEAIFRAMRALEQPRDGDFQAMLKGYREQNALAVERAGEIAAKDRQIESMFTFEHVAVALAHKDARIAELDTELALLRRMKCDDPIATGGKAPLPDLIPAVLDDKPTPPKPHDPFNLPRKDPRRMGPE